MYRLVLYYLIVLVIVAFICSAFGFLSFTPISLVITISILVIVSYVTNRIFAYIFKAPSNVESVYITALILACIITPIHSYHDVSFVGWVAVLSVASKYILAINKKHIFNPAAIGVLIASFGLEHSPSWWIGNAYLMPFVLIGGLMIARKTRRGDLLFSFFLTSLTMIGFFAITNQSDLLTTLKQVTLHSSLLFFGFVMVTEPLTTPPTKTLQMIYGVLVGFLFPPQLHVGTIYSTPELALVLGNIYSYLVSPKQKLLLFLKEKIQYSDTIVDFVFTSKERLSFQPGQYLEWTLQHPQTDSRGNRRYFTIASSPTESDLRLGAKFYPHGSSYKRALLNLSDQDTIVGSQLAGDFTLPKEKEKKLVFLAGGIGITPFRSMIKYLLDMHEKRDIIVIYSAKNESEFVYKDILDEAYRQLGIQTIYTITDPEAIPQQWSGRIGRVSSEMIKEIIPDSENRLFYLSGPHVMVEGFAKTLAESCVPKKHIKQDFFPGFV